ncbi:Ldh family oxidoreductase [Nesterenkonia halophila]
MTVIDARDLRSACTNALLAAGADRKSAETLASATVESEQVGNRAVGVGHLFDYLDAYRRGRITPSPDVAVGRPTSGTVDVDAGEGLAQHAFAAAQGDLLEATRASGIASLWIRNSFTCGELGYYPRRLAESGLIAVAMANSPALMSVGGSPSRILGTNPLAFGFPREGELPVVIDQASSATAFVNIRRAADTQEEIPPGWALNTDGRATQDPQEALDGTLLPFGSHRGGNIALLVELLATLSGASFSMDAPPFDDGEESPGIGVWALCIDPGIFPGSADRINQHVEWLRNEHNVRLPAAEISKKAEELDIDAALLDRLTAAAAHA